MDDFGDAFQKAKAARRATLRELADFTGKSIGYLSDVLHKRKGPPDLDTVGKIETFLGVRDSHLQIIARRERAAKPADLVRRVNSRPKLREALLRIESLSDEELDHLGVIPDHDLFKGGE